MSNLLKMMSGGAADKLYVDDVFSAFTYTGTNATQTITNGIDLATKGGLVWTKARTSEPTNVHHQLMDTSRGLRYALQSNLTNANFDFGADIVTANSTGFTLSSTSRVNQSAETYISWTFRKAPKFFDVVTYTGNGGTLSVNHALGIKPGCIIIKRTDSAGDWLVITRKSDGNIYAMYLNTTASQFYDGTEGSLWGASSVSINWINSNVAAGFNTSGATYVAYLFAHDTSADGIIQCGSYTGSGADNNAISLGWEPQFLMLKRATGGTGGWITCDVSRGIATPTAYDTPATVAHVLAESSAAESSAFTFGVTAAGFNLRESNTQLNSNTDTYIYLAIRRPNKPPTLGTQVYNAIARTGTSADVTVNSTITPDLIISDDRLYGSAYITIDRLRGNDSYLRTDTTGAEINASNTRLIAGATQTGWKLIGTSSNLSPRNYIDWFFRRAPGVFDEVITPTAFTGTAYHNLGVPPELMIEKPRLITGDWKVFHKDISSGTGYLNTTGTFVNSLYPRDPTATTFTPNGTDTVAYLFATKAGISKVGSYTGNGTSQTINCGFTTGARFILVKRTDSTGDWFVWDSVRGIVAGNDPHLSLNTTAAEVTTDDSIDPDTSGFIVNQDAATNINVNAATYIFLAFA